MELTTSCFISRSTNEGRFFSSAKSQSSSRSRTSWHSQKHRESLVRSQQETQVSRDSEDETTSMLIIEKVGDTLLRKYKIRKDQSLSIEEAPMGSKAHSSHRKIPPLNSGGLSLPENIPKIFKDFFLPTDFPDSVSQDYLQYMVWQFPTNVTGWACSTLVTSSLLKAVGMEAWAGTTVAATAAIKWVSKDGLGSFGRLFIGGRFGRVFDDDPKQWRMYAELIGSFGSVFELVTPLKPEWFLPLATLGRLTKALGKGLKAPSFRVIQNHFAIAGNLGEVSAKEEVWEVSAELIGIALGVALLSSSSLAASYSTLVLSWTLIRTLHLWLRYQSLVSLQFSTVNFKRAFVLAKLHVVDAPIPGVPKCNNMENILLPWQFSNPYLHLGCSLRDAVGSPVSKPELKEILSLFSDELHVVVLSPHPLHKVAMRFIFKEGATNLTVLRCIWQAEWIMNWITSEESRTFRVPTSWSLRSQVSLLASSLRALRGNFDDFVLQMGQAGWDTSRLALKIPRDAPYLTVSLGNDDYNEANN